MNFSCNNKSIWNRNPTGLLKHRILTKKKNKLHADYVKEQEFQGEPREKRETASGTWHADAPLDDTFLFSESITQLANSSSALLPRCSVFLRPSGLVLFIIGTTDGKLERKKNIKKKIPQIHIFSTKFERRPRERKSESEREPKARPTSYFLWNTQTRARTHTHTYS